jgi:cytochrome P450
MGKITEQTMNNIFAHYKPDEKVDILHWMTAVTFETIGRIGFGYSFDMLQRIDEPSHPFIDAMSFSLGESAARFFKASFVKKLPTETNNNYKKNNDLMKTIVEQVIKERKEGPDANDIQKDLLGFMLNARDEHSLGLSDQNIRDQVITFLIAGHDTTANTLAWTLYHLALDPEIEAKVLQEIANVGISSNEYPTPEQISSLKYMHRVLKEVLRLYPPVRVLGKYCKKDCVVPGGYSIKAGNTCMISAYNMHRNPDVYPNPTKFDPERWTPEEEQKRSRYAWLPFSTGPRSCIGMAFALQGMKRITISWFLFIYALS